METQAFLDQLLRAGRDWASQGKTLAEQGLGIPEAGPERDATLSAMGKGAMGAGALVLRKNSCGFRQQAIFVV